MADQTEEIIILIRQLGAEEAERRLRGVTAAANSTTNATKTLGEGIANLGARLSAAGGPAAEVGEVLGNLGQRMAALAGAGPIGAVIAAVTVLKGALMAMSTAMALAADDASEMADKMGVAVGRLEELKVLADENSGSVEGFQRVMDKLSRSVSKLGDDNEKTELGLAKLGLTMKDLDGLSPERQALLLVKAYEELGRSAGATAGIITLMGAGFRDQIPMIKAVGEDAGKTGERIDYFANRISEGLIKKGGEAETALTNFKLAFGGLKNVMADGFDNPFSKVMDGLAEAMRGMALWTAASNKLTKGKSTWELIKQGPGLVVDIFKQAQTIDPLTGEDFDPRTKQKAASAAKPAADAAAKAQAEREAKAKALQDEINGRAELEAARKKAAAEAEANAKRIEQLGKNALIDGQRRIEGTKDQTEAERMLFETQVGKYRELDSATKNRLIAMAREEDAGLRLLELTKEQTKQDKHRTAEIAKQVKETENLRIEVTDRIREVGRSATDANDLRDLTTGMGAADASAAVARLHVSKSARDGREDATRIYQKGDQFDFASIVAYNKALKDIDEQERITSEVIGQETQRRKDYDADWTNGAKSAFADYVDHATDLSSQMKDVGTNLFKGMEDALVSFVTTGKAGFRDFAISILGQLARIAAAKALAGIATSIFGPSGGGSVDNTLFANGGAFSKGTQFFAAGDVVNRATAFGMSNGKTGVMGEAGPEAIMPLRRGPDGRLGVSMSGGGSTQVNHINVSGGGSGNKEDDLALAKTISAVMEKKWNEQMAKANRPGGMNNRATLSL